MRTLLRTRLRAMAADDIPQVAEIERESFTSAWPQTAYRRELTNKLARYTVITEQRDPEDMPSLARSGVFGTIRRLVGDGGAAEGQYLLGFIGLWLMIGEGHIVTVAVRERYRRMGIGERLLLECIDQARDFAQEVVTLEVRRSNESAQRLYEKYGFARVGTRVRYYTDNNEDAVIMTTPDILSPGFSQLLDELKARHQARYPDLWS